MARLTKEERKARRQRRRAERKAERLGSTVETQGEAPPRKLGRRERRQAKRQARLAIKLAARPREPVERGPVTKIIVGKRSQFNSEQLAHHNLDLIRECPWPGLWVMRYEGEGYVDAESSVQYESIKQTVGHFKVCCPKAQVLWLNR